MTTRTKSETTKPADQAQYDARTLRGLADIQAGRTLSLDEARENMEQVIARRQSAS